MVKNCLYPLVLLLFLAASFNSIAADLDAGKQKAQTCAACHGADGNSTNPAWPKLAGQSTEYLVKELSDFKSGARKNPTMTPMAKPLSKEDMADIAAYFQSQKVKIGDADPNLVDEGKKVYRSGNPQTGVPACMACHGPDGAGNPATVYPALQGQHAEYTAMQLKAFRSGDRSNDPNKIMRIVAGKMSDKEIKAVADYIQGLY
jgi:cytochrome c553